MKKVNLPEGQSGIWKIEKFEVSEEDAKFENLRAMFSFSSRDQYIRAGVYTRLMRNGTIVMSDTPSEMQDHEYFVYKANGNVLINGLGLGVVLLNILEKSEVQKVIVNEISEDVITLVSPHYSDSRLTINHIDAFDWKSDNGDKYNAIWHDIWDYISEDNKKEMAKLCRKYSKWKADDCYQECWGRDRLRRRR